MPPNDIAEINVPEDDKKTIVVCGLGMVGLYFIERVLKYDVTHKYKIEVFCEEPLVAYNRVGLTQFFSHRSEERMLMQPLKWYSENNVLVHTSDKAKHIDTTAKIVTSENGLSISYDECILATGSYPFVPPIPGWNNPGVFVYRTIEDLNKIITYAAKSKRGAVIGGGLLGLEAAKALKDLDLDVTIIEMAPVLMARQLDTEGGKMLQKEIEKLDIKCILGVPPKEITVNEEGKVNGIRFEDKSIEMDMVIVAAGIRPRDELAKASGISTHARGGVFVDEKLQTNIPNVYAIGEVALHAGMIYGLVAPGYDMAEVVAINLTKIGSDKCFPGGDLSSKLKLLGVHVASFGDYFAKDDVAMPLVYNDPFGSVYKKYLFSKDGKHLLGGIMVGDTEDYTKLHALLKSKKPLPMPPGELILGVKSGQAPGADDLPDEAQVCSCNNVTKGQIRESIKDDECRSVGQVKSCTKAGTGCGGCIPLVTEIFNAEMKSLGHVVTQHLCPHFDYTRAELFQIIKIKKLKNFQETIEKVGKKDSAGCEVCKPTVASIVASLWNEPVLDHWGILDTNDRYLANLQRGGSYSVVPRVPGGEITPEKLIVLGQVAKRFGLYTKITGGQRVDLFGAEKHDLPQIWEELVNAGFESGHAYGKALRTVKSCVGSTWCRYGIGDSVGFAIQLEDRYKGIRAPHKIKGAVSGCIRECAEAQGKDFGLIATETGFNVYVCGNGGAQPKHGLILAKNASEENAIKYLDRFLMYYIHTADHLTRTARWLEKMDGGIEYLRKVIIDDHLGICKELEEDMARLIYTYQCEWAEVVKNPSRRAMFQPFANSTEAVEGIEYITERGQRRPADWPKDFSEEPIKEEIKLNPGEKAWVKIAKLDHFLEDAGQVVKYGDVQIAIYNTNKKTRWYATQNMCPHKRAFVLSQGIVGDENGTTKVSCPMHKKNFALETGECLSGDVNLRLMTFDIKVEDDHIWLHLPPTYELDRLLGTSKWKVTKNGKKPKERIMDRSAAKIQMLGTTDSSGCAEVSCGDKKLDW
ncbi:nitrite reductase NADPH small subunit [Gigaspora margarita]|uniref:Nitrite reductase [NAD(P)H] n=1 Tax=Gigaspora margarita TaxID=4874 RepID=A0A8H4ESB2_GIGMA|nr:nitrite reductase NADPH small subunit [Gigaspora margarita]